MDLPKNLFKAALQSGQHQLGVWNNIGGPLVPEALASLGYDWVLVDTEHTPTEAYQVQSSLQSIAGYPKVSPVVRPVSNDPALIKRYLDMGAQTLMIPYVQSVAEAEAAVTAMRYPPHGIRGMAGGVRATGYGQVKDYALNAEKELCLIVQIETAEAAKDLEAIATVPGVDAVFVGPADLSASMGHPGNPNHPEVLTAIEDIYARLKAINVPSGILTMNEDFARRSIELGTGFTAIATDMGAMLRELNSVRKRIIS